MIKNGQTIGNWCPAVNGQDNLIAQLPHFILNYAVILIVFHFHPFILYGSSFYHTLIILHLIRFFMTHKKSQRYSRGPKCLNYQANFLKFFCVINHVGAGYMRSLANKNGLAFFRKN